MERRDFVKSTAVLGMAAALPRYSLARAKGNDRIKVGLIGCGGRGRGALCNMISADQNIEIVAVADLFADKPQQALDRVQKHIEKLGDSAKGILDMSKVKRFVGLNLRRRNFGDRHRRRNRRVPARVPHPALRKNRGGG